MSLAPSSSFFPSLLKNWRTKQRLSQLDLALEAGLSQRHISFLETGRSQPSRQAIAQIGEALTMPAAEIDAMLTSAGFAPLGSDTRWSDETREAVNASIDHVLRSHEPYPAFSVDRIWNLQKANHAALAFFGLLGAIGEPNILRAIMMPGPLRSRILNWEDNTRALLRLLELEVVRRPNDQDARTLLDNLLSLPGVTDALGQRADTHPRPVLTLRFDVDGAELSLFSMIATIGMSADAALDDTRIETLLPADDATRSWFSARSDQFSAPGKDPHSL